VRWDAREAKNVEVEMEAWLIDGVSEIWMVEEGIDVFATLVAYIPAVRR
jgi:hypothetical protein